MLLSILLLVIIAYLSFRVAPVEKVLIRITDFFDVFGVRRPIRFEPEPIQAGDYNHALHADHPEAPSLLDQYLDKPSEPKLGGAPKETAPGEESKE